MGLYNTRTVENGHRICVAPMMDVTDRHCRYFLRQVNSRARLYTEMITGGALIHGDVRRHLEFDEEEHPVALQLGGSEPDELARCAKLGEQYGYDEINLNIGCPSERVQRGAFGACLMAEPALVAQCVSAIRSVVSKPVTVKHRIGIDQVADYSFVRDFVGTVAEAGCRTFIVHARKAILTGLSPAQNRTIPPLDWTRVSRLKKDFPMLTMVVNGGFDSADDVLQQLPAVDGVMVGRAAYHNPWILTELDTAMFGTPTPESRFASLQKLLPYVSSELESGARLHDVARHLHGMFNGLPGARRYRRHLAEHSHRPGAAINVLVEAASFVNEASTEEGAAACSSV